jgi:hypothetical protein
VKALPGLVDVLLLIGRGLVRFVQEVLDLLRAGEEFVQLLVRDEAQVPDHAHGTSNNAWS